MHDEPSWMRQARRSTKDRHRAGFRVPQDVIPAQERSRYAPSSRYFANRCMLWSCGVDVWMWGCDGLVAASGCFRECDPRQDTAAEWIDLV